MQTKIAAKKAAFILSLPKLRTKKGVNDLFEIQISPFLIHENISEKTNYVLHITEVFLKTYLILLEEYYEF